MQTLRSWLFGIGLATWLTGCSAAAPGPSSPQPSAAGHAAATSPTSTAKVIAPPAMSSSAGRSSGSAPVVTTPATTTPMSAGAAGSGNAHPANAAGSGGMAIASTAGSGAAGAHASAGASGSSAAAGSGAAPMSGSHVTGTLGALGDAQPVMAGWATTNGLETLVYLSSAPLTCAMMMTQGVKWLSKLPAKSQVIEIVVGNPSNTKKYTIGTSAALGGGEVNYAEGSKSSSTEVTGRTGSITFTKAMAKGVQEGTFEVTAPYMASGTFHAEWCEGGTEY